MPRVRLGRPAFIGNGRADAVEKHLVTRANDPSSPRQWLYLCGPAEAAVQVELAGGPACVQTSMVESRQIEYSHRFEWSGGLPTDIRRLVELLEEVRTLRHHAHLDFAVVLDWYKIAEDGVEPGEWKNTAAGELIYRG